MKVFGFASAILLLPGLASGGFVDRTSQLVPGLSSGHAAWCDFNRDGYPDLSTPGVLYQNLGGTNFTALPGYGWGFWADFDNDGRQDMFDMSGRRLLRNDGGTGRFAELPLPSMQETVRRGACWADLDGNGFVDLYVGGYEVWNPPADYPDAVYLNQDGARFTLPWIEPGPLRARGVTACDFDEDHDMDIFVSHYRLQPNGLLRNDGSGVFTEAGKALGVAGNPGGAYPHGHTIGSAWGDLDNDGHFDLFVGNFRHNWGDGTQDHAAFLRNRGPSADWQFELVRELAGSDWQESYASPALADYDNDGDLDLYLTTVYGGDHARLYRNDGNWNFVDVTEAEGLDGMPATYMACWADYDADGDLDLATGNRLYENRPGQSHHWLKVRLEGNGAMVNRSAIGAQVRIDLGGGRILTRQVEAGTGEGNQNDLTLHFGLGPETGPVTFEITWPDGTSRAVPDVSVDQTTVQVQGPPDPR